MFKKFYFLFLIFSLILSCGPIMKTRKPAKVPEEKAEKVIKDGLVKYTLKTKEGKVEVYLPETPIPNSLFTGRVIATPKGKTDKEKEENFKKLEGIIVTLKNVKTGEKFTAKAGDILKLIPVAGLYKLFFNKDGKTVKGGDYDVEDTPPMIPEEPQIPEFSDDFSFSVRAFLDGNLENSSVTANEKPCDTLVETVDTLHVYCPNLEPGEIKMKVYEGDKKIAEDVLTFVPCRIVGQRELIAGEKTEYTIQVKGKKLKNCTVSVSSEGAIHIPPITKKIPEDKIKKESKELEVYNLSVSGTAVAPGEFVIFCDVNCKGEMSCCEKDIKIQTDKKGKPKIRYAISDRLLPREKKQTVTIRLYIKADFFCEKVKKEKCRPQYNVKMNKKKTVILENKKGKWKQVNISGVKVQKVNIKYCPHPSCDDKRHKGLLVYEIKMLIPADNQLRFNPLVLELNLPKNKGFSHYLSIFAEQNAARNKWMRIKGKLPFKLELKGKPKNGKQKGEEKVKRP